VENKRDSHVESFLDLLLLVSGLHGVGREETFGETTNVRVTVLTSQGLIGYNFPRLRFGFLSGLEPPYS
jgi:hypothetical protein